MLNLRNKVWDDFWTMSETKKTWTMFRSTYVFCLFAYLFLLGATSDWLRAYSCLCAPRLFQMGSMYSMRITHSWLITLGNMGDNMAPGKIWFMDIWFKKSASSFIHRKDLTFFCCCFVLVGVTPSSAEGLFLALCSLIIRPCWLLTTQEFYPLYNHLGPQKWFAFYQNIDKIT